MAKRTKKASTNKTIEGLKEAVAFASTDARRVENNPPQRAFIPGDPMRLNYRVLTDDEKHAMGTTKEEFERMWMSLDRLGSSREISIAKTHLEDACMWAVKHITGPKKEDMT